MSEQKLFQVFQNKLGFDPEDYLVSSEEHELTDFQKKAIENATAIMKDNIIGEVKSFGGSVKANEEKFKELEKRANEELEDEQYEKLKKELKNYVKKLRELIEKTCAAIIPVKEMPWVDVLFRTVPRIVFDKKVEFLDNAIAYYGEIKCIISRSTIFGKMKNEKPLFAPIMGSIDLGGYKLDETKKGPKSQIYSYVSAIIDSFDSTMTRNHLAKYHEAYQRHGDPICDFLMKDNELMNSMERVTSGFESNRLSSDIAVFSIAVPQNADKTTLLVVVDEGKDANKFSRCFEALLKFSAEGCNLPSSAPPIQQPQAAGQPQQPGGVRTPGGQELKVWTAEELASEAQKRMESQPDIPEWTEEDLSKFASERGSGLPEGMEVWTEEDLLELARKRQGGLDIPEWEPDKDLKECTKCGYALRPGWSKCPHCGTPVGAEIEPGPSEELSPDQSEESKEESDELKEEISTEEPEEKKEE
ncbi:MAG: zinc-ribbon domain-containing protein [Candidatus Hodarchaeota archaeon]